MSQWILAIGRMSIHKRHTRRDRASEEQVSAIVGIFPSHPRERDTESQSRYARVMYRRCIGPIECREGMPDIKALQVKFLCAFPKTRTLVRIHT